MRDISSLNCCDLVIVRGYGDGVTPCKFVLHQKDREVVYFIPYDKEAVLLTHPANIESFYLRPVEITQARKSLNFSQSSFAKITGVSRKTVARWEAGEAVPSVDSMKRIRNLREGY